MSIRRPSKVIVGSVLAGVMGLSGAALDVPAASAETGSISGTLFEDLNRNGVHDSGEGVMADRGMDLLDSTGRPVAGTATDTSGSYLFSGLADGVYTVALSTSAWRQIWEQWVPTTTSTSTIGRPASTMTLSGASAVHFGFRPITWSVDLDSPLSFFTATDGLRLASYNDAMTAQDVDAVVRAGRLVGEEASAVLIRFGYGTSAYIAASTGSNYSATIYLSYRSWLEQREVVLFHEYGHAWAGFYSGRSGDMELTGYLAARGLTGDPRLGSEHAWYPGELIAEDYRQLFGSPRAAAVAQENRDIPAASQVPGLESYLRDTFRTAQPPPIGGGTPSPPPPEPTYLSVADLDGSSLSRGGTWTAKTQVTVRATSATTPLDGTMVTFRWRSGPKSNPVTTSCTTDATGRCEVSATVDKRQSGVTFEVVEILASGASYLPSGNGDPDGDSSGTTITVAKPR